MREPRKQKIDRVSIERKNNANKYHIQTTRERISAIDAYKVTKDTDLCGYCAVFLPERIGGAMMTSVCCAVCEKEMMFSNTNTDLLCPECAITNKLCKHCGGELIGDGCTSPIRCEFVDIGDMVLECDANPLYCGFVDYGEDFCVDCGGYSPDSSWCDECLDKLDIDEYEERKRKRLAEQQEY